MTKSVLNLASAFLKVADAVKPLIPLIATFAAFKAAKGLTSFVGGVGAALGGARKKNMGGMIGMNRGGVVPGRGNRDTVPAMLTPGEFVIRKSSVKKIGADRLHGMNKYANGGKAKKKKQGRIITDVDIPGLSIGQVAPQGTPKTAIPKNIYATHKQLGFNVKQGEQGGKFRVVEPVQNLVLSGEGGKAIGFDNIVKPILTNAQKKIDKSAKKAFGGRKTKSTLLQDQNAVDTIGGFVFESFGSAVLGKAAGDKSAFDYMGRQRSKMLETFTESDPAADLIDAKKTHVARRKIVEKALLLKKQKPSAIQFKRKALGGFARFAMGGIVNASKVGAAILDPDAGMKPEDVNVGLADVRKYLKGSGGDASIARRDLNKIYSGKKYKIYRQGLNKDTSERFRSALLSGAAKGLSDATSGLSSDLGLGNAALTKDGQGEMEKYLGSRVIGQLYEAGVGILSSQGKFKDTPPSQPFDYPNGLGGKLRDNFDQLPGSWVDAKSSYAAARDMKGKIANEIADEYKRSGEYNKAIANHKKRIGRASGGGISGRDTVPALLTPGEFVINKKSAQRIGRANLEKMNKQGVAGFNAGGPVGPKKMFLGGDSGGGGMGKTTAVLMGLSALTSVMASFADDSIKATDSQAKFAAATQAATITITKLLTYTMLIGAARDRTMSFIDGLGNAKKASEAQAKSAEQSSDALGKVSTSASSAAADTDSMVAGGLAIGGDQYLRSQLGSDEADFDPMASRSDKEKADAREMKARDLEKSRKEKDTKREEVESERRTEKKRTKKQINRDIKKNEKKFDMQAVADQNHWKGQRERQEEAVRGADAARTNAQTERDKHQRDVQQRTRDIDKIREESGLAEIEKGTVYEQKRRARKEVEGVGRVRTASQEREAKHTAYLEGRTDGGARDAARIKELQAKDQIEYGPTQEGFGVPAPRPMRTPQEEEELKRLQKKQTHATDVVATEQSRQTKLDEREKKAKGIIADEGLQDTGDADKLAKERKIWNEQNKEEAKEIQNLQIQQGASIEYREEEEKKIANANKVINQASNNRKVALDKEKEANAKNAQVNQEHLRLKQELSGVEQDSAKSTTKNNKAKKESVSADKQGESTTRKWWRTKKKASTETKKDITQKKKAAKSTRTLASETKRYEAACAKARTKTDRWAKETAQLNDILGKSADITDDAAKAILKKNRAEQKQGKGSRIGRGLKGAARAGTAVAGGVGMALGAVDALASGITSYLSAQADRRESKARARGDVKGAAAAAEESAMAQEMGQMFSFGGMMQMAATALTGVQFGPTFEERQQRSREAGAMAGMDVGVGETDKVLKNAISDGMASPAKVIAGANQKMGAALSTLRASGMDPASQKAQAERFRETTVGLATFAGQTAQTSEELEKALGNIIAPTREIKEAFMKAGRAAFKVAEAQRILAKANFDNLKVLSGFNAANLAVGSFLSSLETGSSDLGRHIATFEASLSNIGMSEEGKKALQAAQDQVLSAVGGEGTSLGQSAKRTFDRASGVQEFMGSLQSRISGLDISGVDDTQAREDLEAALTKGVQDADIKQAIGGAIAGLDKVVGKDVSQIAAEIQSALGPMAKGALDAAKAFMHHEQTIVKLTQRRRQSELQYIAAQKASIDQQLQLADQLEAFGGAKLGQDEKMRATLTKANLTLQDAGISGLTTGTTGDFSRARQEIMSKLEAQQVQRLEGGFAGAGGVDADRIKELNSSLATIAQAMQERAGQIKTEIDLINKKNAAEKSSIEALMAGDIDKYFEQQQTAGAAIALRSGDSALAGLFGAGALGRGFASLQGTALSDREMERAAGMATSAAGLTDPRSAQVLAGTADGADRLRTEGQELTKEAMRTSQAMADAAGMEVKTNQVIIKQAKVKFEDTMADKVAQQGAADASVAAQQASARPGYLRRGGVVYANRGVFVPRGTDTVPAMLTPGEFVVNRNAVQRGNNLQILRAMNTMGGQTPAAPAAAMSNGGQVGYYALGDLVKNVGSVFGDALPSLAGSIGAFTSAIDKLTGFKFEVGVTQVPPITVNLAGGNILNEINSSISQSIITEVANEIGKYRVNQTGKLQKSEGVTP